MTQEEKLLLYKDLCARMPYGVVCSHPYGFGKLDSISAEDYGIEVTFKTNDDNYYMIEQCMPYLRRMSSMTEEEKDTYDTMVMCNASWIVDDWLNAHHFDYRRLIEKGLALEAPKDMYKTSKL